MLIFFCNASVYVDFSFARPLHSIIKSAILNPLIDKSSKTLMEVLCLPVFDFLSSGRFNLSNNISPSCLGEAILNSSSQ